MVPRLWFDGTYNFNIEIEPFEPCAPEISLTEAEFHIFMMHVLMKRFSMLQVK